MGHREAQLKCKCCQGMPDIEDVMSYKFLQWNQDEWPDSDAEMHKGFASIPMQARCLNSFGNLGSACYLNVCILQKELWKQDAFCQSVHLSSYFLLLLAKAIQPRDAFCCCLHITNQELLATFKLQGFCL